MSSKASGMPETTSESLLMGAAGGAAIGSVVALGFDNGSVILPLFGGVVGAGGGALLGYLLHRGSDKDTRPGVANDPLRSPRAGA